MNHISDQLVYATTPIKVTKPSKNELGTGFFVNFDERGKRRLVGLVTNRHVVKDGTFWEFLMHHTGSDGRPVAGPPVRVPLESGTLDWIPHPNNDIDLAVLPLGPIATTARLRGTPMSWFDISLDSVAGEEDFAELSAVEDILMVGYPQAFWDEYNNLPIVRKGITATSPYRDFQGKKQFVIDCACFPGSSGSPVYLYNIGWYLKRNGEVVSGNRVILLGVLYSGPMPAFKGAVQGQPISTEVDLVSVTNIPINLGCCVKADELLAFRPILMGMAKDRGEI